MICALNLGMRAGKWTFYFPVIAHFPNMENGTKLENGDFRTFGSNREFSRGSMKKLLTDDFCCDDALRS